jgi:long-chain acyl-CoA synthetase
MGIVKGDRVAYFLQNSPQLVTAFYGALKAGAVVVPCNPMYRAGELARQLADSGARALVCDAELLPVVQQARGSTALETVVVVGGTGDEVSFERLVDSGEPLGRLPGVRPASDLALLCYTGGTTGEPKGAMLTHRNMVVNAAQFSRWYGYVDGREVFVAALPLFHIGGIAGTMSVPISVGGTLVLFRRFNARGALQAVQDYGATRFLGVPTMYIAALNLENARSYDLSSLSHSRTSAAPLPAAVKRAFDALVGREVLIEGYGLTETAPLTHANPVHRAKEGSIGVPLPGTDARIVDPEEGTRVLPRGRVGELVLRGPQVMRGYWGRPAETADAIRDGWFHTGDLARMDDEGYFYIVDRKKDVINAAGFKVWPREVEEVLYRHPSVRLAAVVGAPDSYRGETVKAVVVLREECRESEEATRRQLLELCRAELAAYKLPRILEFRASLPVSAAGKLLKRELR